MTAPLTIKDLEKLTQLPRHVVDHAVRRYGPAPVDRVGIIRLWRSEDLDQVFESLRRTAANSRTRRMSHHTPQEAVTR